MSCFSILSTPSATSFSHAFLSSSTLVVDLRFIPADNLLADMKMFPELVKSCTKILLSRYIGGYNSLVGSKVHSLIISSIRLTNQIKEQKYIKHSLLILHSADFFLHLHFFCNSAVKFKIFALLNQNPPFFENPVLPLLPVDIVLFTFQLAQITSMV
uniref:Uncharacterized protein n=1 Tax=Cacopsylla melanoneura TaxID=428564 RepID=A0A8D9ALB7_9HEMI